MFRSYLSLLQNRTHKREIPMNTAASAKLLRSNCQVTVSFSIVKFSINVPKISAGKKMLFSSLDKTAWELPGTNFHFATTKPATINRSKKAV